MITLTTTHNDTCTPWCNMHQSDLVKINNGLVDCAYGYCECGYCQ